MTFTSSYAPAIPEAIERIMRERAENCAARNPDSGIDAEDIMSRYAERYLRKFGCFNAEKFTLEQFAGLQCNNVDAEIMANLVIAQERRRRYLWLDRALDAHGERVDGERLFVNDSKAALYREVLRADIRETVDCLDLPNRRIARLHMRLGSIRQVEAALGASHGPFMRDRWPAFCRRFKEVWSGSNTHHESKRKEKTMSLAQDGAYSAHLVGATVRMSASGKLMVVFRWRLDGIDGTLDSYSVIRNEDGSPNEKAIGFVRRWCTPWDGSDPYWLAEHAAEIGEIEVRVTVRNEPSYRDPNEIVSKIRWVNPKGWCGARTVPTDDAAADSSEPPFKAADEIDFDALEPTMQDAWSAYAHLCREVPIARRNSYWVRKVGELVPGKDQIDFTPDDWAKVIKFLKG